jgi:hypothetical protein
MIKMQNMWGWHKCRAEDAIVTVTAVLTDKKEEEAAQAEKDAAAPTEEDAAAQAEKDAAAPTEEDAAAQADAEAQNAASDGHAVAPEKMGLVWKITTESR